MNTEVYAKEDPAARLAARRVVLPAYNVELGPRAELHEERARLDALEWSAFKVKRLGATIGAELSDIRLTDDLDDDGVAEIRRALLEFKVIFFRNQPMTATQHVAFAERFGDLEVHPFIPSTTGEPTLVRFDKDGDSAGYENGWHQDVTWRSEPSMGAILRSVHVPTSGGDTLFADMAAAYDGLDDETKKLIDPLTAIHDFMLAFGGQVPAEQIDEVRQLYPPVEHPVVRTHPETERRLIFVNPFFTDHIVGMPEAEGRALIGRLSSLAGRPEYQCRFQWEADSIAFWDNRIVQHYAASDYWPERRIIERASVKGDRPY